MTQLHAWIDGGWNAKPITGLGGQGSTNTITTEDTGTIRQFSSGATRDSGEGKMEPWGFNSVLVERAYDAYMNKHRTQSDGNLRDSDNWQKGFPFDSYWHSLSRHVQDFRLHYEGYADLSRAEDMLEALLAMKFNTDGMIYELLVEEHGRGEKQA